MSNEVDPRAVVLATGRHDGLARRQVLRLGAAAPLLGVIGTACDAFSTDPAADTDSDQHPDKGPEAPSLAQQVEAGSLPPVVERLPDDPLVVQPADRIGSYGGAWNTALLGVADSLWMNRTIGYEGFLRWTPDWSEVIPNIAASVEVSDDGRDATISLRAGMRWSDGEPFTANDIVFAFEDVYGNEDLSPVFPSWLMSSDEQRATVGQLDDLTFILRYEIPNGLLLDQLACGNDWNLIRPRHYLEQFHPTYNADLDTDVAASGFADWTELFWDRADLWSNPELPRLHPWVPTSGIGDGSRVVAERNPYYWKVDPDGSQLPYLDSVVFEIVSDTEVLLIKTSNGELNFHTRHINVPRNKPVLAASREAGDYDFVALQQSATNEMVINFNLTHEDPVKREVFSNLDFRIGLSYAINRDEMVDVVFQRQGEPWQSAPSAESRFYDEEMAKQYTEYDPDRANEFLDLAGYTERDDQGYRLGPDGSRILVDVANPQFLEAHAEALDLVIGYWDDVGIDSRVNSMDRSYWNEFRGGNQHDAGVWIGEGGFNDEILRAGAQYAAIMANTTWGVRWGEWYLSRGADGEEPPAEPLRQIQLYRQLLETPDEEERDELFRQVLAIAKEQFYTIGTVRIPEGYGIVAANFHNVPGLIPEAADFLTPGPTNPEQYFIS